MTRYRNYGCPSFKNFASKNTAHFNSVSFVKMSLILPKFCLNQ